MEEWCAICGCKLNHKIGVYAKDNTLGRAHASRHHYVAERFFGRSRNRKGKNRTAIFKKCPWGLEGKTVILCYDCHEELLTNPVLLPEDIKRFSKLVKRRNLAETSKTASKEKLRGRIKLLQEVIATGVNEVLKNNR